MLKLSWNFFLAKSLFRECFRNSFRNDFWLECTLGEHLSRNQRLSSKQYSQSVECGRGAESTRDISLFECGVVVTDVGMQSKRFAAQRRTTS